MYRCAYPALAALLAAAPIVVQAQAIQRNFPQNALRGAVVIESPSEALLNGKPARLAPGLKIRGQDNLLQMSGALVGAKLLVHYTVDIAGLVNNIWILTPQEAAKKPWPATAAEAQAWQFDPIAQTWAKP